MVLRDTPFNVYSMAKKRKAGEALPPVDMDVHVSGLRGLTVKRASNGDLELRYETGGVLYSCTLKTESEGYAIRQYSNLPTAIAWSLLRDIRRSSLEEALAVFPKRIRAYALRRTQVDDTIASQESRVAGRKIHTTSSCSFVRLDLNIFLSGGPAGIIRFDLWYTDFSVHPTRQKVSARGPPDFVAPVSQRLDAIHELLRTKPLNDVCEALYN